MSYDERRPVPSHYIGRCGIGPPLQGVRVDHMGPWWTESFMEKLIFTRVNLSDIK
jgi:hypothetical protein